jgi:photosystem II stability/assembly factor-like uncharacterized protein
VKLALRALLVVVVVGVVTQAGAAAGGPTHIRTVANSILFWNAHDGLLAASQCPQPVVACERAVIERTTDGGRTYRIVFRVAQLSLSLQPVGDKGAIASTDTGKAWRTLNRGRTWKRLHSDSVTDWLDPEVGIRFHEYVAHRHVQLAMRVTHDGGHTWRSQPDPCNRTGAANDASADLVTAKRWWIVCEGEGAAGNEDKAIFRTRNGGATWRLGAATDVLGSHPSQRGGISSYGYPDGLAFASDGWGLLTESRGTLYVTRDGGMHFHAEPNVAHPEVDFAGGAAAFPGGVGYVFLGEAHPRLLRTHDYGRSWVVVRRWDG